VPYLDMLGWEGGRLPLTVQQALHHEVHRRGLRQLDIADLIGVSRSHLANLQRGRFGASPESAARIREFLIAGAKTVGGPP
jgi:transcriptional regulator with XRE-family HTH domain